MFFCLQICTLFYEAGQRLVGCSSRSPVKMPKLQNLQMNYRTHSGVLNVASTIVDLLKTFFPLVGLPGALPGTVVNLENLKNMLVHVKFVGYLVSL